MPSARLVFDPLSWAPAGVSGTAGGDSGIGARQSVQHAEAGTRRVLRPRELSRQVAGVYIAFYRDPVAWLALAVSAVMLCYVGGLAMFWFHAVHLAEGGPAISWYAHWLLDSTFGFVALTPALFLLIPVSVAASRLLIGPAAPGLLPWMYTAICGSLFAVVTMPGPIAHNLIVGRGTWVANEVTKLVGDPTAKLAPATHYTVLADMTQQLGAGIPVYVVLTGVSLVLVRALVGARRRGFVRVRRRAFATR
jgi:hypothetical protein